MNVKKNLIAVSALAMLVIFTLSATMMATSDLGTQTDPLITLSYLNEQYKPRVLSELAVEIDRKTADLSYEINGKINDLSIELQAMGDANTGGQTAAELETHSVVSLSHGQTVTFAVGAEIMPRIGTVTAVGIAPALINTTSGETVPADSTLSANSMYMVTIEGNGITAASDNVKVLIKGIYTIN